MLLGVTEQSDQVQGRAETARAEERGPVACAGSGVHPRAAALSALTLQEGLGMLVSGAA